MKVRTKSTVWRAVWPVVIDAILIQQGGIQTPRSNENSTFLIYVLRLSKIGIRPFGKPNYFLGPLLKNDLDPFMHIRYISENWFSIYPIFFYREEEIFYLGGGGCILFCPSLGEDDNFAQINLFDLHCYRKYPKIIYQRNFVLELFTCSSQCNHKSR